jgi:hypothetical protein
VLLKSTEEDGFRVASGKIIYVARLCQAIPQLCDCLLPLVAVVSKSTQNVHGRAGDDDAFRRMWEDAKSQAYGLWRKRVPLELENHFASCAPPEFSPAAMLSVLPVRALVPLDYRCDDEKKKS